MDKIATRKAYGNALIKLGQTNEDVIVLDAETSNSTYAEKFKQAYPNRFIESFIAEQNMVSMALGLSRMGKIPFVSTFAAFFTRAADQIRMSQYSDGNIKFVGSHAGISIGQDGSSQMGLEDISLFRCMLNSTVLYPSDSVSTEKLVALIADHHGNCYLRTTRADTPVLYNQNDTFRIGGSKTLKISDQDEVTVIGAGITLHEALKAYEHLQGEGISIRVIDLYSIKPLDKESIAKACQETKALIVVEDHYQEGGIYEAVCGSGANVDYQNGKTTPIHSLCVRKMTRSGTPEELLAYAEIDAAAIINKVKTITQN
jgi:transketolase